LVTELYIGGAKVAVAGKADSPPLGRIVWYSVSERPIPFEELERMLDAAGIPEEFRPSQTRPSDAFKSAVRDVQGKDYVVEYDTYEENGVKKTNPRKMLIVRRVHDVSIDALRVAATVEYDPDTHTLNVVPGLDTLADEMARLHRTVYDLYETYRGSYKAEDIRTMISTTLKKSFSVMVKKHGGVYFTPQDSAPIVDRLAQVIENLPGCEMVSIPVIDTEPERKTLIRRYETATLDRIESMMLQVKEIVSKGEEIVPSVFGHFYDEVLYLSEQKAKYEGLLSSSMSKVDVEMQALASYLGQLSSLVKQK